MGSTTIAIVINYICYRLSGSPTVFYGFKMELGGAFHARGGVERSSNFDFILVFFFRITFTVCSSNKQALTMQCLGLLIQRAKKPDNSSTTELNTK